MSKIIRNEEFRSYIASYSGCNGGNKDASLWVCAIEPGGETEHKWLSEEKGLPSDKHPKYWSECWKDKIEEDDKQRRKFDSICFDWKVDKGIAKLLMKLGNAGNPSDNDQLKRYMGSQLYTQNGACLRLNLFPLPCPSENSKEWGNYAGLHPSLTEEKEIYREFCRENRFPFFQGEASENNPHLVLGIGLGYEHDFAAAFGFSQENRVESEIIRGRSRVPRRIEVYKNKTRTLIVTPFFGWRKYQINVDFEEDINELSHLIENNIRHINHET